MKILCIEVGTPPPPINDSFGYYPNMLEKLLIPYLPMAKFSTCSLIKGESLPCLTQIDGFVIMGSPYGVYEDLPWLESLMEYILKAANMKIPHCGICFGHQLIAKVHGGRVEKAPQGWGIGRHTYQIVENVKFGKALKKELSLLVSHQDQVLDAPKNAKTIARSDFTPHAMLHYEDDCALTCQAHPEFSSEFAHALISTRRGTRFSEDFADKALETIHHDLDAHILADLMANHFQIHNKNKSQKIGIN